MLGYKCSPMGRKKMEKPILMSHTGLSYHQECRISEKKYSKEKERGPESPSWTSSEIFTPSSINGKNREDGGKMVNFHKQHENFGSWHEDENIKCLVFLFIKSLVVYNVDFALIHRKFCLSTTFSHLLHADEESEI